MDFLSSATKISFHHSLRKELQETFTNYKQLLQQDLQQHIDIGDRICHTTDAWSTRNFQDYAAVTVHWVNANWQHNSKVLGVVHLRELIHIGEYFAETLLKVTNSYGLTKAIFTVTRDNASANTVMLKKLGSVAAEGEECSQQLWPFTVREDDVCCMAHIINLAVQAALRTLSADSDASILHELEHLT